jgi:hypothetical protein
VQIGDGRTTVISHEKLSNNCVIRGGPAALGLSGTSVGGPSPVQTAAATVQPLLVQCRGGARKICASARACDHKTSGGRPLAAAREAQASTNVIAVTANIAVTHLIVATSLFLRHGLRL